MKKRSIVGEPQIFVRIHDIHSVLDKLKQQGKDTAECDNWVKQAEEIYNNHRIIFYSAFDRIWQILHRIRHIMCRIGSISDLLSVLVDIRGCLSYVVKEERKRYEEDIEKIENSLRLHLLKHEQGKPAHDLPIQEIRFDLERLSRLTADARDTHWRKVNLLRTRLLWTAVILFILLCGSLWLVPPFLSVAVTWEDILAIITFGAIGGIVSALSTMEPLEESTSVYYIRRILLWLKPLIGAASALVIYLIQISGVIKIVPADSKPQAAYLVLAFVAGFSERFFISEVEQVAGLNKKKKKQKEGNE